jgi:signal transduction histidine kinase
MNVDANGVVFESGAALDALSAKASAPIFTYDDSFFDGAIVGGPMDSVLEMSAVTASVANRILSGEKAGGIKTPDLKFAAPKFDWRQMQRWGISESNLPAGSAIYFRSPTAWETYRWQIVLACTVIFVQAGLISGLVLERRRRHHAEGESKERISELAHVNRFAIAGELTTSITHEINQPLGSILINAESAELILQSSSPDLDELRAILVDIRRDENRASEVIRRLKSLLQPFEARLIDLNDIAREAFNLLAPTMRQRGITLRTEFSSTQLPVKGDPIQLQQVILNLIGNAIQAMSETNTPYRILTLRSVQRGTQAELVVSDTGKGIPPENLEKIFESFFSTRQQGMGVGLSIARTIVAAHGARSRPRTTAKVGHYFP